MRLAHNFGGRFGVELSMTFRPSARLDEEGHSTSIKWRLAPTKVLCHISLVS